MPPGDHALDDASSDHDEPQGDHDSVTMDHYHIYLDTDDDAAAGDRSPNSALKTAQVVFN
jgi:hypothetical protein